VSIDPDMARRWLDAARDPAVVGELRGVFGWIAREVEARGPACWASGRCCNFERSGHLLYVTGLEAAYALVHAPPADTNQGPRSLSLTQLARARGGCPFQSGNLCSIHTVKPSACRIYFCDRGAREWQQTLSESVQARLRDMHDAGGIPYFYGEWRVVLETVMLARGGKCSDDGRTLMR
jgi:Fe-S-cluster containining protein